MSDITIPGGKIRSFVERVENIDSELQELNEQKKEIFAEAKGEGLTWRSSRRSSSGASRTRTSATSAKACSIYTCGRWKPRRWKRQPRRLERNGGLRGSTKRTISGVMQCCPRISLRSSALRPARGACKNFQRTFTTGAATTTGSAINHP